LVVEVRAAERAHEEVVGERVVLRPLPHLHLRAVEVAHHPGADVAHGDELVVRATVDLLAVLVIGVDRVWQLLVHAAADRRQVDAERAVRQVVGERGGRLALHEHRRQLRQRRAVVVELRLLLGGGVGDALGAREEAVQVVEAAVLGVDDDDGLDLLEAFLRSAGAAGEKQH
jgi:hypothetical protein